MTTDIATKLQELLDREAIRDLPARYCHCVWRQDVPAIVDLFTEDGSIAMGTGEAATRGHAELRKMYERALNDLAPRPFIHNHVVELQGSDRAIGTCYVEICGVRDSESMVAAGFYDDVYRKVGGAWKFQSRDVTMHYMTTLKEGWAAQIRAGRVRYSPR